MHINTIDSSLLNLTETDILHSVFFRYGNEIIPHVNDYLCLHDDDISLEPISIVPSLNTFPGIISMYNLPPFSHVPLLFFGGCDL
ncbi:MAG TPA: hypothetical protein DCG34_08880 [Clostridiales bacterium]|jgi:hypothetical protein|nr:hypothetical protein [Clostridiales bacterium]